MNPGTERKSTGSYYTRPELVHELIKSALEPVIEERIKGVNSQGEKIKALLALKVCDPAAGSGHFLLAAARRIATELAKVKTGEEQPTPVQFRMAVREVIQHCVYGVDINPLAVDLCKVALWLEGHNRGLPLTFLDHRIRCGNSLVGLDTMGRLKNGIPDEAFEPVTGDVKDVARKVKAINHQQRQAYEKGQMLLPLDAANNMDKEFEDFVLEAWSIDSLEEKSSEDVHRKQETYQKLHMNEAWYKDWTAANIWSSAFFYPLTKADDPAIPTFDRLMRYIRSPESADSRLVGAANDLATNHHFFHWPLEFPEIAEVGGFDVVLGNPPWERIKLQEPEFFAVRDPEIAKALNSAERAKLIKHLPEKNPALAQEFARAQHDAEAGSRFIRSGQRFPLTAVGDINTYAIFAELVRGIVNKQGRAGIIVPTGIAIDDTCKMYFRDLNETETLVSLFDFENSEGLFSGVHRSYKFSLLTVTAKEVSERKFAFFLTNTNHLNDKMRLFEFGSKDIALVNPNTRTMPVFRTKIDAELTKSIYHNFPVLVNDALRENPWGVSFLRMFDMSNDSHLFATSPKPNYLPLYEGKSVDIYDHRFANIIVNPNNPMRKAYQEYVTENEHQNTHFDINFEYWVEGSEIAHRINQPISNWFLVYKRTTTASSERTLKCCIVPFAGIGDKIPVIFIKQNNKLYLPLLGNLNSLVEDFVCRQKTGYVNLAYFVIEQLPILKPNSYLQSDLEFICPRVLELTYTSYVLEPFANDMGYEGPPFKWDEDRRALLRAELDAYYAHLYSLTRDELRYILDPQEVYGEDFPGETFRVLKDKELKNYGEYRTRRLVLEAWDRLFGKGGTQ